MAYKKEYTPEETREYNERKKAEMEEIFKKIDEGVQNVFNSDKFREYLKFVSKFTNYSVNNTLLINMQNPQATLVAPFGKWQKLGRFVNKGEQGIQILAPVTYKTNNFMETERPVTDEFGNQLYNEDGTEKTETVQKQITDIAFKKAYVFDVSQTDGKEIPTFISDLSGDIDAAKKEAVFAALKKVTGIDIEFENIRGSSRGYCSYSQNRIVVREGMSDAQTLKTAFHETAHKLLHDPKNEIVTAKSPRNEKEVHAESVAFIVAEKFEIDTSEYSFPYIASWSDGKQLEQLKNALREIQEAAKTISSAIESELLKMQKRGLSIDEKLADAELNNIQKAEFLIEECSDRGVIFSAEDTEKILDFAEKNEDIYETAQFVSDMEIIQMQRDAYGYDFKNVKPFDTKNEALKAFDKGEAVYLLYPDNTEKRAENISEIENFDGYFGLKKEPEKEIEKRPEDGLIAVSKAVAIEMYNKNLDVFIGGIPAENISQIENAPVGTEFSLIEYQYAAELDFDKTPSGNIKNNPKNIIGNTSYTELGEKSELKYYTNLKNRHANNIAKALDENGIKFSGLIKGTVTTITINKADITAYEAAVEKVKASYQKDKSEIQTEKPVSVAAEIDKAISENNFELYRYDMDKAVDSVIQKCGVQRTSKILADYINYYSYDGRISAKNKAWAKNFEPSAERYGPVFKTHPAVLDGFIESYREKIKSLEIKPVLPSLYDDKFLYSSERVELRDDYRGIPETKYFNSSANEYFVEGIGWLDDFAYDRELKMSGLSAKDFYAKVTKINADYIDLNGNIGQIDVSKSEYELLTEKTYSPENSEKLEAAKNELSERKIAAGITEKPVEYYAVRQTKNRKFEISSISADGLVTPVKPDISTVAEAKAAMLELFESKKNSVKCEIVHPQTLDEKSAELYQNNYNALPEITYRIQLNSEKNAVPEDTHFLQEYIKNPDDSYKIGEIICSGNYDICNAKLAYILQNGDREKNISENRFEIYQIKRGDENRDIRFQPFIELIESGRRPDFSSYDKVYEGDTDMLGASGSSVGDKLEAAFVKFNNDRPDDFTGHSLSVSDVVVLDDKAYYVDSFGFQPLKEFKPREKALERETSDLEKSKQQKKIKR